MNTDQTYPLDEGIFLDPAIPSFGVHRVSFKRLNYNGQNTGIGITFEPMVRPQGVRLWDAQNMFVFAWANGANYRSGVNVAYTSPWQVGNLVTMVVDMVRNEFWVEVDGKRHGSIEGLNISLNQRNYLHFIMATHTSNGEVEIIDPPQ